MDPDIKRAVDAFLERIVSQLPMTGAILFGSRARHTHHPDSDVDIAVILSGSRGQRIDRAIEMAGIAFDVLLDTGILVQPLPLWEEEWEHPEYFNNPSLIETIRREGIRL